MARKSFVEPLFVNELEHWEEEAEAAEAEDEELCNYGSERIFPFPAKGGEGDNHYRASRQKELQKYEPVVSIRFRRKDDSCKWSKAGRKHCKVNNVTHSVVSRFATSFNDNHNSGKRGAVSVYTRQQNLSSWRNHFDAPWRS